MPKKRYRIVLITPNLVAGYRVEATSDTGAKARAGSLRRALNAPQAGTKIYRWDEALGSYEPEPFYHIHTT